MNIKELQSEMKKTSDKMQNDFIDKLKNDIDWLCEKSNKRDYEPTEHERNIFNQIVTIINNMRKWF